MSPRPQSEALQIGSRTVTITHPEKVLFPNDGITKRELVAYYQRIAATILRYLRGRPIVMERYPDGINGQHFYEKDAPKFTPAWVKTFPVPRRGGGTDIRYILINDLPTLVWCANLASLELHPFLHHAGRLDRPDAMVFDLDRGRGPRSSRAPR